MIYLHALTPIHTGIGQVASVVDLPIAREKSTGWPIIPSTSLKGVLRDMKNRETIDNDKKWIELAFGGEDTAGGIAFGDQRILCLPIRSYFGTFAYVTCPLCLSRLIRDSKAMEISLPFETSVPGISGAEILLSSTSILKNEGKVYLEDLDLSVMGGNADAIAKGLAKALFPNEEDGFVKRFAIVSDDIFNFLSETAMEVDAHIKIQDDTKTVQSGMLWYEETVPAEAIFAGPFMINDFARKSEEVGKFFADFMGGMIQIGGNASTGCGLCRMVVAK